MDSTRYASVLGLGFGDCGKGRFVDALSRRWSAHTIVRSNGGAQAGHNVIASRASDERMVHHTFSQFGSGTFVPGVRTVLLDPMIVHPTALLVEAEALARAGVHDALPRLTIDARCRVTTPYHQAAGRLRERLRGAHAHGTCGVGVGETVRHSLDHPSQVLRYGDLFCSGSAHADSQLDRLQAIRETLLSEFPGNDGGRTHGPEPEELATLRDESIARPWLNHGRALARQCPPATPDEIHHRLTRPGCVLFEGAQGVLLDESRGFHPHTTWSSISSHAVEDAALRAGITAPIEHYGVLRSYLTRHGAGPFPTWDPALDAVLPEPHNHGEGWQGRFRRGHPDAVLLRYALEAAGTLSGLLVSHLDVFRHGPLLKWCGAYSVPGIPVSGMDRLPHAGEGDLDHQSALANLLFTVRPCYGGEPIAGEDEFFHRLGEVTSLPVVMRSYGPADADVS